MQLLLHAPSSSLQLMPTSLGLNSKEFKFPFMTESGMKAWAQVSEHTDL